MEIDEDQVDLTFDQLARIKIIRAVRGVLAARTFAGSSSVNPLDVIQLSRYIETGNDPLEDVDHDNCVRSIEPSDASRTGDCQD